MKLKLTALLLLTSFFSYAQDIPFWIQKYSIPLDTSLIKSSAIQKYLKNEQHILLGEPTHGDGTIMDYKVSLIRMLHEKYGYDVIMFEADMLKFYAASKKGLTDTRAVLNATLPTMWSNAAELERLIDYIDQQNRIGDSLFVVGFDTQLTQASVPTLNTALPAFMKANNITLSADTGSNGLDEHRNFFSTLVLLINKRYRNNTNLVSTANFPRFEETLHGLRRQSQLVKNSEGGFWNQTLGNIIDYLPQLYADNRLPHKFTTADRSLRDSIMANNFSYLVEQKFKGKKTISWAATDHIRRNVPGEPSKKMGEFLKQKLTRPPYVIGFTAGAGEYYNYIDKKVYPIPDLVPGSFEYFGSKAKKGDFFLDLRSNLTKTKKSGFGQKISMRPMAYYPITTDWTIPLDAVIYVDQAKASKMLR